MKKITKIVALLLTVVMVFTGCATVENSTVIYSNGSAKVTTVMDIEKAALDKAIKEMGYTDPEAYFKQSIGDYQYYEVVTIDEKQYYEIREVNFVDSKSLSTGWSYNGLDLSEHGYYITKDTVYGLTEAMNSSDEDDYYSYAYYLETYKSLGFDPSKSLKVTQSFEFPANITATNGIIDAANAKKVTFNIDITKKNTIFATTNSANTLESVKKMVDKKNTVKKPTIKSLKIKSVKKKGTAVLKLKKQKGMRFEIEYSTSKKFKLSKTEWKDTKKTTVTLKKLKKGKKYYVRVRAYKQNYAGSYVYSKWVKKTIKVPKKTVK